MKIDFLIVGQGLAGSALAVRLLERGHRVLVVENGYATGASKVAAGVLNPVTGRWLVKSWMADTALPVAKAFYRSMEVLMGSAFFEEREILRLCRSDFEAKRWAKRRSQSAYSGYVGEALAPGAIWQGLRDESGSFPILRAGWVDTTVWLAAAARYLKQQRALLAVPLDYREVSFSTKGVYWQGYTADKVVFCEGWAVCHNPWFRYLPMEPSKGEVLTLRGEIPLPRYIINARKWILPLPGHSMCRVGSTWEWGIGDAEPTTKGRNELLRAAGEMLLNAPGPHAIVDHACGIRPSSTDRLPLVGVHPREPRAVIFNGLGAKGVLLAPWLAAQLIAHLEDGLPLPPEADIARFGM